MTRVLRWLIAITTALLGVGFPDARLQAYEVVEVEQGGDYRGTCHVKWNNPRAEGV